MTKLADHSFTHTLKIIGTSDPNDWLVEMIGMLIPGMDTQLVSLVDVLSKIRGVTSLEYVMDYKEALTFYTPLYHFIVKECLKNDGVIMQLIDSNKDKIVKVEGELGKFINTAVALSDSDDVADVNSITVDLYNEVKGVVADNYAQTTHFRDLIEIVKKSVEKFVGKYVEKYVEKHAKQSTEEELSIDKITDKIDKVVVCYNEIKTYVEAGGSKISIGKAMDTNNIFTQPVHPVVKRGGINILEKILSINHFVRDFSKNRNTVYNLLKNYDNVDTVMVELDGLVSVSDESIITAYIYITFLLSSIQFSLTKIEYSSMLPPEMFQGDMMARKMKIDAYKFNKLFAPILMELHTRFSMAKNMSLRDFVIKIRHAVMGVDATNNLETVLRNATQHNDTSMSTTDENAAKLMNFLETYNIVKNGTIDLDIIDTVNQCVSEINKGNFTGIIPHIFKIVKLFELF